MQNFPKKSLFSSLVDIIKSTKRIKFSGCYKMNIFKKRFSFIVLNLNLDFCKIFGKVNGVYYILIAD